MSSKAPIIVLLGAGPNTGLAVARKFHSEGWKVVCVARTEKPEFQPYQTLFVKADFSQPETLTAVFEKIESEVGIPNVITHNAYSAHVGKDAKDLFASVSVEDYAKDLTVNSTSNFAAIKLAIAGFKKLPADATKVYLYMGNMCTGLIVTDAVTLGPGKEASLWTIENAAAGYGTLAKWYNVDERDAQGNSTMNKISGEAHAKVFWNLANDKTQREINYTFVKDKGYVKFEQEPSRPVANIPDLLKIAAENAKS